MREIAHGSCDGTGAAINVILGFVPSYVKVWNVEHANEKMLEWHKGMDGNGTFTTLDEGVKTDNSTVTPIQANGISAYNGGDWIYYDGVTNNRWEKVSDDSDAEEVFVDGYYEVPAAGTPLYKCYGEKKDPHQTNGSKVKTAPGFTIGTNDINTNGEQLCWMAFR